MKQPTTGMFFENEGTKKEAFKKRPLQLSFFLKQEVENCGIESLVNRRSNSKIAEFHRSVITLNLEWPRFSFITIKRSTCDSGNRTVRNKQSYVLPRLHEINFLLVERITIS